jgi:hypothetical protein
MVVVFLAAGIAAPAAATPVTVYFDEPSGFGVSAESANAAFASDVPFVYPDFVGSASGVLSVISQELQGDNDSIAALLLAQSGNNATSIWTVENEYSKDLLGDTYFLFVTTMAFSIEGEVVEYDDANVGLTIDSDLGWVLVRTSTEPGQGYYYPAMSLGSLGAGATAAPFAVNYVVDQPIQQVVTQSATKVVLPQLAAGMGFAPIPEPTAGVLMGVGLALLAVVHRRRS